MWFISQVLGLRVEGSQKALRGVIRWTRVDVLGAILWGIYRQKSSTSPKIDFLIEVRRAWRGWVLCGMVDAEGVEPLAVLLCGRLPRVHGSDFRG